ncbi:helix-turn-helix domain-containing protein [Flavitalea sp.]|nr:AraC family transcriptional regulator [Flavitalea sp.]
MAFEIRNIPGKNFQLLNDFFMNGSADMNLVEQSEKLSLPFVDVNMQDWYFDGIRLGYSDWHYKKPVDLKWNYQIKAELVTLQANLKGSVFIGSQTNRPQAAFGSYQHNLYYANGDDINEGFLRSAHLHSSMFFIQFTKDTFLRLTQGGNEALERFGENIMNGRRCALSNNNLPVDAAMLNIINDIINCRYKDGLKQMYLLSKSIEFLVVQAEACNAAFLPSYKYVKTKHDLECLKYAREYILNNIESPPALTALAKIVGINEYKLKRGFKEVFGNTVFGYLSDARLELAKNDLLRGDKTSTEIASGFGYSSLQHFSNAFKKKFGFSPNKLLKKKHNLEI